MAHFGYLVAGQLLIIRLTRHKRAEMRGRELIYGCLVPVIIVLLP